LGPKVSRASLVGLLGDWLGGSSCAAGTGPMADQFHSDQLERQLSGGPLDPLRHLRSADVEGAPTAVADQMLVGLAAGLHRLIGVGLPELDLARQAYFHQQVEGPVDGGALEAGDLERDPGAKFVGGGVTGVFQQRTINQLPLRCQPPALSPDRLQAVHIELMIPVVCYCNIGRRLPRRPPRTPLGIIEMKWA